MALLTNRRYEVASLTPVQLLHAAMDFETRALPDLAPLGVPAGAGAGGLGSASGVVAWRDPGEPMSMRLEGAAGLLRTHAPALARLEAAGFAHLPRDQSSSMTAALRTTPAGVIRLLDEIGTAGRGLPEFLAKIAGPKPSSPTRPERERQPWTDRAIADLSRRGWVWSERSEKLTAGPAEVWGILADANKRLIVLGQPITVLSEAPSKLSFITIAPAGSLGPPLHAHEGADQFELLTAGEVRFRIGVGPSSAEYRLRPGSWLAVGRMTPHTFVPVGGDATIASVVQGPGADRLAAFFRKFDGTPDPERLAAGEREAFNRVLEKALAAHGIRLLKRVPRVN